jgi:hypothetical protein
MLSGIKKNNHMMHNLAKRWKSSLFEITRIYDITQRDLDAPTKIKGSKKIMDSLFDEMGYIVREELRIEEKLSSFDAI